MAIENKHQNRANADQVLPIVGGAAVTTSDSVDLVTMSRALWVGTGGNIVVITMDGSTITLKNVQNGTLVPIRVTRVKATSTTATDIVNLY